MSVPSEKVQENSATTSGELAAKKINSIAHVFYIDAIGDVTIVMASRNVTRVFTAFLHRQMSRGELSAFLHVSPWYVSHF